MRASLRRDGDDEGEGRGMRLSWWARRVGPFLGLVALLGTTGQAAASIKVAGDAHAASLRVGRAGNAEVGWSTSGGERRSLLVSPSGALTYGGRLPAGDVSVAAAAPIPFAIAVRRTPDGALWALQAWQRLASGPV